MLSILIITISISFIRDINLQLIVSKTFQRVGIVNIMALKLHSRLVIIIYLIRIVNCHIYQRGTLDDVHRSLVATTAIIISMPFLLT